MSERWHHVRTDDGWEIRDENALLIASLHNPKHDREADARMIADAPRLREHLNRYGPTASSLRERLVREMVVWKTLQSRTLSQAHAYYVSAGRLAKALKRNKASVLEELEREAAAIIAHEGERS